MSGYCTDPTHTYGYQCARCGRTFCFAELPDGKRCDKPSDVEMIKTAVRYCPDWRCQRERQIEEGQLLALERRQALVDFINSARYVGDVCKHCNVGIIKPDMTSCPHCGAYKLVKRPVDDHAYLSAGDVAGASGDRPYTGCYTCGRPRSEHTR